MSKTNIRETNWTPVIDSIVAKHGAITALVFGVIWRYCQMHDGECKASQSTIAKYCGLSRKSVNIHAQKLVENGYLTATQDKNGIIHYKDTGKAGVKVEVMAYDDHVTESYRGCNPELQGVLPKVTPPVTESYTNNSINIPINKLEDKKDCHASNEATPPFSSPEADKPEQKQGDKQKKPSKKNPLTDHPAIKAIKTVTNRNPRSETYEFVISTLGNEPNIDRLKECYQIWVRRGSNPMNIEGYLDWYIHGIPPKNGNGHKPQPQPDYSRWKSGAEGIEEYE